MIHRDTANDLLETRLGSGTPQNVYLALTSSKPEFNDAPEDLYEPSAADYERLEIVNNKTSFPDATNGIVVNGVTFEFPAALASWGTIRHWALVDETGIKVLFSGRISQRFVGEGRRVAFLPGTLTVKAR